MKTILGKQSKRLASVSGVKPKIVLNLAFDAATAPKFKGFEYTVAEGLNLARRCYTELPEFASKK